MTQPTLFDICAAKHKGNRESKAANLKAEPGKLTLRQSIYYYLRMEKPNGATCKELADHFNKPMHSLSGRIAELKTLNLVEATPQVREGGRVVKARAL